MMFWRLKVVPVACACDVIPRKNIREIGWLYNREITAFKKHQWVNIHIIAAQLFSCEINLPVLIWNRAKCGSVMSFMSQVCPTFAKYFLQIVGKRLRSQMFDIIWQASNKHFINSCQIVQSNSWKTFPKTFIQTFWHNLLFWIMVIFQNLKGRWTFLFSGHP